jgi:hypothetical protein
LGIRRPLPLFSMLVAFGRRLCVATWNGMRNKLYTRAFGLPIHPAVRASASPFYNIDRYFKSNLLCPCGPLAETAVACAVSNINAVASSMVEASRTLAG